MKRPMTTEELFDRIKKILKEKGKLPEILDYGLGTYRPVPIRTYEFDLKNNLAYGGNEGIYLNLWIEYLDFVSFWPLYRDDMKERLRENTVRTKDYIMELKVLPYFGKKKMTEITAADIRRWQNSLMKQGYSQTYLKTINNQISAVFNYAVKYYDLPKNPCTQAGSMGKGKADEMKFWTQEGFETIIEYVKDKPISYYAFLTLFWTGIRLGELLALTLADFDPEEKTLSITKSYQRINGRDVVTEPKTAKSKRVITLPDFLVLELEEYVSKLYGMMANDRLFSITKSYLEKEMNRGVESSGVKKIRLHDLRYSHASLLISRLGA